MDGLPSSVKKCEMTIYEAGSSRCKNLCQQKPLGFPRGPMTMARVVVAIPQAPTGLAIMAAVALQASTSTSPTRHMVRREILV